VAYFFGPPSILLQVFVYMYILNSQHLVINLVIGVILTGPGSIWFGFVRKRSDFVKSGSVNRKRVYDSVCDQSEPSS